MSGLPLSEVAKNVQHLLSDDGHIQKVTKESRALVKASMDRLGLTAEQHAEAMVKLQALISSYKEA